MGVPPPPLEKGARNRRGAPAAAAVLRSFLRSADGSALRLRAEAAARAAEPRQPRAFGGLMAAAERRGRAVPGPGKPHM
jgi:hypothetical protein